MSRPRAVIVLQARMGSRRLPGKSMADLCGAPLVEHAVRRLVAAEAGPVVVATTALAEDDVIADCARALGAHAFRGPVEDVLHRYVLASAGFDAEVVIRATADNPAVDVGAPARVLEHLSRGADYVVETGLPVGAAVEALRRAALLRADAEAVEAYDREHVTPFVKARVDRFVVVGAPAPLGLTRPDLRLTVDTAEDLAYMRRVFALTRRPLPDLGDVIAAADRVRAAAEGP